MATKYAFIDRDGATIYEPPDDFQIDSLEKLFILPGVIQGFKKLIEKGYKLVMVTNQNGIGTPSFPTEDFLKPQNRMIEIFKENGVEFEEIFVCPHFPEDNCSCRKPKTGLVDKFFEDNDIDLENSFMYGDRDSDGEFAKNLGIKFFKVITNGQFAINIDQLN
ncbi:histidinol-phosphatase [Candidatus Peregrinibacteria bacterium]|jgi:imidazoleglycerol-phosphate dehydratase / histidinol-phosphatase|nr:histidinol-phosphatase [Candidatus Peregrinibacteria bacterium]